MKKTTLAIPVLLIALMSTTAFGQNLLETFSDGDFTANPAWSGDAANWTILTSSDVAAGATNSYTLRLNAQTAITDTQYLSTQIANWGGSQEWGFFLGRRNQAYTLTNKTYIWLYANEADLQSTTVDGYRLVIGDNIGGDQIFLESVTNKVGTVILTSQDSVLNALVDIGFLVRVTRSNSGAWELFTSTLPSASGTGAIASDVPNAVNASISQGTVTNTAYTPSANGYFGIATIHTTAADPRTAVELDQIYFTLPTSPSVTVVPNALNFGTVALTDTSAVMSYTVSGANLSAGITITAPSTDFRVSTTSGSGYTNTLTIPQSGGTVPPTAIYVIFKPTLTEGLKTGNITNASIGATTQNVAVSGTGSRIIVAGGPLSFGAVVVGNYSSEQTYVVHGRNLTEDITITAPSQFQVSLTSGSGFGSSALLLIDGDSVAHTTVYARFAPTVSGNRTDSVRHSTLGAANRYLQVAGRGVAAQPTVQASNIAFSAVTATGMTVSWTRGNGAGCIVLARCEGPVDSAPVDGYYYAAADSFGKGAQVGSRNYAVYKGSGTSVAVKKLYGITTYHYSVYEYNGGDSVENYLAAGAPAAFRRTAPSNGVITLNALGTSYSQNFNGLDTASQSMPTGWHFCEVDSQANYLFAADNGGLVTGNVYSYGSTGAADRGLGTLQTGKLLPAVSAAFVNNTGAVIPSLDIAYTGEQWRLGTRNRHDTLKVEISKTPGSWIPYAALNLVTPDTSGAAGARDGNSPFYRAALWLDLPGVNIAAGDTFLLRWSDANASGSDDGLAIDDLTLLPFSGTGIPRITHTSPVDTAKNVARAAPVRIGFSERMKPASLAYTCSPNPGGWSAAWNANFDTVTLSHSNFTYYTAYTFTVTAARDSNENYQIAAGSKPNPFSFTTQSDPAAPPMRISVLDVGQAAATVIRSPTGKRILIDAYSNKNGPVVDSLLVSQFLKDSVGAINTPYLDYLFLTHWDHDHAGYADVIIRRLDSLNVASYDRGPLDTTDGDFVDYKAALTAKGWWGKRTIGQIGAKQTIDIGNGASIQIVSVRGKSLSGDSLTTFNENNWSLGVLIRYGNFKMSITGDLESQMENILAGDFDSVNVMHVNHHGSAGSSTTTWVNALNPQTSIISVGNNSFVHPTIEAIQRLTSDPGSNNYIYQTERGDTTDGPDAGPDTAGMIPPGRGRITNRNIHIEVTSNLFKVDGDVYTLPALGVELSGFAAAAGAAGVTLTWSTQSETDCYRWHVERSASEAGGYEVIGSVPGHGNTSQPQQYTYLDNTLSAAGIYWYRLAEVDLSGTVSHHRPVRVIYNRHGIAAFQAGQAYPNPANAGASISYQLPLPGTVSLGVYNVLGQLVRTLVDGRQEADYYTAAWNGRGANGQEAASGVYFYRLQYQDGFNAAPRQTAVKKLVLIR